MLDRLVITWKCEHAVIGRDGVIRCPYRDKQKKWLKQNVFIPSKATFPICPKRMAMNGEPLVCAKYELRELTKRSKSR